MRLVNGQKVRCNTIYTALCVILTITKKLSWFQSFDLNRFLCFLYTKKLGVLHQVAQLPRVRKQLGVACELGREHGGGTGQGVRRIL
mgnify:CR=1 FL=1